MVGMVGIRSWFVSWFGSWFGSWFVSWFVVRGSWFVVRGSIRFDSIRSASTALPVFRKRCRRFQSASAYSGREATPTTPLVIPAKAGIHLDLGCACG
jgi:hypothetical protein